jgi:hypothetical protein
MREAAEHLERHQAEQLDLRRNMAERRERRLIEEAMNPPAVDFSQCSSIGEMTMQQFSGWIDAGRPELPAARAEREGRELQRRVEKAAAPAPPPASAPGIDWRALGEAMADEMNLVEQELRRECDRKIAELRAEVEALRAELGVRNELAALRAELEQLRQERRLRAV